MVVCSVLRRVANSGKPKIQKLKLGNLPCGHSIAHQERQCLPIQYLDTTDTEFDAIRIRRSGRLHLRPVLNYGISGRRVGLVQHMCQPAESSFYDANASRSYLFFFWFFWSVWPSPLSESVFNRSVYRQR